MYIYTYGRAQEAKRAVYLCVCIYICMCTGDPNAAAAARGGVRLDAVASGAIKGCTFLRPASGAFTSEACGFDDGGQAGVLVNWLELVEGG